MNKKATASVIAVALTALGGLAMTASADSARTNGPVMEVEHEHSTDRLWRTDDGWIVEVHSLSADRLDTFHYDTALEALRNMGAEPCVNEDGDEQALCFWDAETRGNGDGDSFIVNGGDAVTLDREPVSVIPAPEPEPVAPPATAAPESVTPEPVDTTPASLCDPEITDLHCDPETGEYYDDPPMECVPAGFLSPGAVAPVGIEPCDGLTVADTYDTN